MGAAGLNFLPEVSADLASWLKFPGADLTYVHSGGEFRTDASGLASRLVESWPAELVRAFTAELRNPRRLRQFSLDHSLVGSLQVLDRTRPLTAHLAQILQALRIVGRFADYAFVRMAAAGAPDLRDIPLALSRPETPQERATGFGRHRDVLQSRVVDAYVAQELTASHLSAIADMSCFEVERLTGDRYLAYAKRPAGWLDDSGPQQDLANAQHAFARVILRLTPSSQPSTAA